MLKKVDSKISLTIILSCFLVLVIQGAVLLKTSNTMLFDDIQALVEATTKEKTNLIEQRISRAVSISDDISSIVAGVVNPDELNEKGAQYEEILDPIIKKILSDNIDQVMGAYLILDPENTDRTYGVYYEDVKNNKELEEKELYDIELFRTKSPRVTWYYDCIDKKDGVWYEPYLSEHHKLELISFTKPIYKDDKYIGLLSIDLNFQILKDFVNDIKLINSGYVFIINEAEHFVIHKTLTVEDSLSTAQNGEYKKLSEDIKNNDTLTSEYIIDSQKKHLSFDKLSNGWSVCSVVGEDSLIANKQKILKITLSIIIISVIISILFAKLFCRNISKSITYMANALTRLRDLNLTIGEKEKQFENKFTNKNQIGIMITSLSLLRSHLAKIIPELQEKSNNTSTFSDTLSHSIHQSFDSMSNIASSVENISQNSKKQIDESDLGVKNLNVLANMIENARENTENVNNCLNKTQLQNQKNIETINDLVDKFIITQKNTEHVSNSIRNLSKQSEDISNIVTTI